MIDRMFYKFFAWIDSLYQKVEDVWTFDIGEKLPKKKRKKKYVKIANVNVIVRMIYTCITINKICVFATTVNVNNYASIKTF